MVMGGKGGGKAGMAQASGTRTDSVSQVLQLARNFAKDKLGSLQPDNQHKIHS